MCSWRIDTSRSGQVHEQNLRLHPLRHRRDLVVEQHDQVDVAGIVELAGAELAHAKHDPAGTPVGFGGIGWFDLAGFGGLAQNKANGRAHRRVGETGQRRRHPHHVPDAAEVGERREQRRLAAAAAERGHQFGLAGLRPGPGGGVDEPA